MNNEMSPEMSKQISSILSWLEESARSAQGFAIEQAPLVAQEIIKWELVSSIISLSIITLVCIFLFIFSFWSIKKGKKLQELKVEILKAKGVFFAREEVNPYTIFGIVAGILSAIILIIGVSIETSDIVKAQTAPRLVIIDYVKSFNTPNR